MALFQKLFRLESSQFLPISISEAWDFFSSPENLKEITPKHMGFDITSRNQENMYSGMLITYVVTPFLGIRMRWCTEITQVVDNKYFIDEQRFGPYNMWHHQHHFKEVEGGIEMTDIVTYGIPFGIIGQWANSLFVKKQLTQIFEYRTEAVYKVWPSIETKKSEPRIEFFGL